MAISIVIPTIGTPPREIVQESLESALNSDPSIFTQIIVVDNSGNSEFNSFVTKITSEDSRVEVHKVFEKLSMAECWNFGLKYVKYGWHIYLHDDDVLLPESWSRLDLNADVGIQSLNYEVFGNSHRNDIRKETGLISILKDTPKFVSTLFNTKKLREIGGWKSDFGYFLDLVAMSQLAVSYGHLHYPLNGGRYRVHRQNASHVSKRNSGYGDCLPNALAALFSLTNDPKVRKVILIQMANYTYPNNSLIVRTIKKAVSFLGLRVWIVE